MIDRIALPLVKRYLKLFPAVSLLGPRQVGKTTLAKSLSNIYFDLEKEGDQLRIEHDWESISNEKSLVIIDEAQAFPKIFSQLRSIIDEDRKRNGRFLLLGSIAPELISKISQSLAGRIASIPLCPFVINEFPKARINDLWLYGGFPDGGIMDPQAYPIWQNNYLQKLMYIDFEKWGFPGRPQQLERILKMLAAVNAQQWNASQIGKSLGINYQTVNAYVDFLEGAYLIRKLRPYYANLKKRLVKSSKLYFRDTGILHALLHTQSYKDLYNKPWLGSSWEGFVIENILNTIEQTGISVDPYFLRTSDGYEIDLILEIKGNTLWSIEIKMGSSPTKEDLNKLKKVSDLIGADRQFLLCQTEKPSLNAKGGFSNLKDFIDYLKKELE